MQLITDAAKALSLTRIILFAVIRFSAEMNIGQPLFLVIPL